MTNIRIGSKEKIHFIGIGGIGMSGLAQVMHRMGFKVQGSDISKSKNVEKCKKIGIKVFSKHEKKNLKEATIVVRSSAIKNQNIESKCKWSPFNGFKFKGTPTHTIISGKIKMQDGKILGDPDGTPLQFS